MNYHWLNSILLLALLCNIVEAKIAIFTHYFGQPEFIKYQYLFFKKNLLDEYELNVFDDSNDILTSEKIRYECDKYGIKHIRIPRVVFDFPKLPIIDDYVGHTSPSFECAVAIQYIYDNYVVPSDKICLLIDNDIFLISPFSIEKFIGSDSFAYNPQSNGVADYMLPNFLILNPSKMPEKESLDFNLGVIKGNRTDSGGFTHFYLQKYRNLGKVISTHYFYDNNSSLNKKFITTCPLLFTATEWGSYYFVDKETFLHLRMGSNWSRHNSYYNIVNEMAFFFNQLLQDS